MKCKVGDLAVSIQTCHRCNLGTIVRIIAPHDGTGDLVYTESVGHVWLVEAPRPMKWTFSGKTYRRKIGPVPDSQLQPILGESDDVKVSAAVKKLLRKLRHREPVLISSEGSR